VAASIAANNRRRSRFPAAHRRRRTRRRTQPDVIRIKREYQSWVANETLEDYALRYAARAARRWSPGLLANTAIGGISFLALEAIGGSLMINHGFANAFAAILLVSVLIFVISLPIAYHSSVANVDIDLLTRGAGFGYIGSTVTSLIYASFTFIFFALEAAIMAQALEMSVGLNVVVGYLVCSLVIIPMAFYGVTLINRLQQWTQPIWVVLLVLPFVFILYKEPGVLAAWAAFPGRAAQDGEFNWLAFGTATGVLFSLMGQIGEQVDYLRFLPERTARNRIAWWAALLSAGPGWIVIGGLKILAGGLLAFIAIRAGLNASEAVVPITMYVKAYEYVFDNATAVLVVAAVFVVISQIKINVTNAYAGSLAWSNVFARLTHYHPGRVVWLVFNVLIALLLMLLGIFATLESVLSVYSNVVIAWLGALVADLVVLKPLGISPSYIEFKRAHLYDFNPVGCGAMLIASLLSIAAYSGLLGEVCRAFSAFIALGVSFVSAIAIGYGTRGKYYIARADTHFRTGPQSVLVQCAICERDYEPRDMAHCPFYGGSICSLCCGLENHCHDACKSAAAGRAMAAEGAAPAHRPVFEPHFAQRLGRFLALFSITAAVVGAVFLLSYRLLDLEEVAAGFDLVNVLLRIYAATLVVVAFGTWWIVLSHDSRELAEGELVESLHHLEMTRSHLVESEKMASLGGLVAGVAHEINTPVGIAVSTASYLQDRTAEVRNRLERGLLDDGDVRSYLDDAEQSAQLLLTNANRAAQLVQSFKQVAVDQTSDERRRFDLRTYVEETLVSLQPKLKGTQVAVHVDCPQGIEMDSYPGPLAQVITNLVLNSLQHAFPPGGSGMIRISAKAVGGDEVELRHEDDGRGIPSDLHDKVFEPFFTTRRGFGGSGLGLHLVYNIVTGRLNGTIEVAPRNGGGTLFVLRLPRIGGQAASLASALRTGPRSRE
jgi:signal transduction histidine kinase/purine-cytosine permease-like protein